MKMIHIWMIALTLFTSCKKYSPVNDPITYGSALGEIATDKAFYSPGQPVKFILYKDVPAGAKIRYRNLSQTISEESYNNKTWQWTAPTTDFTGYMVDVYTVENGQEKIQASIGVDVSSDYKRFPRNGFLSKFGQMSTSDISAIMTSLNRYHINVVQYQDWQYKHHLPMAGTAAAPAAQWKDIANRDTYFSTVKGYVDASHSFGMKSLFYNLAFGALSDAVTDGVSPQWYLYKDAARTNKDFHPLGAPFKSNIDLLDPSNTGWQQFIAAKNKDVYDAFGFDGYQIDQLGDRGQLYNASGTAINLAATYKPFIQAMKTAAPAKSLVMNAVNQYGAQGISEAPVDFLYTEVWSPNETFDQLATIIKNNEVLGGGTKKTVLAAYMNYDLANNSGFFNTAGVLLADAVIFAFGGSHLELGEHMLGKEYFPNENLQMRPELKTAITAYYDFLTGYENLLRDGGTLNTPAVACTNGKMTLNTWPPQTGQVSVVGKSFTNRQVLHFINFASATSLNWRDTDGRQATPATITDAAVNLTTARTVSKVWMASPDENGVVKSLTFSQSAGTISFSIPSLKYWDMVVVEYQ